MPAVRDIYFKHPTTGEAGLWIETTSGLGLVGKALKEWPSTLTASGGKVSRADFETKLNAALQALLEQRIPLSSIPPDDPIILNGAEPGCRIEGSDYVIRTVGIFVPVISLGPPIVLGPVELSEAASRSVYV